MRKKLEADKHLYDKLENAVLTYMFENDIGFNQLLAGIDAYLRDPRHLGVRRVRVNNTWTVIKEARSAPKADIATIARGIVDWMLLDNDTYTDVCKALFRSIYKVEHQGLKLVANKDGTDWVVERELPYGEPPGRKSVEGVIIPAKELETSKANGYLAPLFNKYFKDSPLKYGAYIASGAEGDVYKYGDTQVIKYSTTWFDKKLFHWLGKETRLNIRDVLKGTKAAIESGLPCIATVSDFKIIGKFQIEDAAHKINPEVYFAYYMVSEKLFPVSWGPCENIIVKDVDPSARSKIKDRNIINGVLLDKNAKCLSRIKQVDPALFQIIMRFNLCTAKLVNHHFSDLHIGNIMQNKEGVLKIIDFGNFEF